MKRYLLLALAVGLALVLIPAAMCARLQRAGAGEPPEEPQTTAATEAAEAPPETPENETIRVYMSDAGAARTLSMRDYIISAVAGEMPAVYEPEALKAQALASVTLARYMKARGENEGLSGAVISTDPAQHQGYMPVEEMRQRWGENFTAYYEKIAAAVDAVLPQVITYNGAPILAAFHAVSPGVTETAANVWGADIPYLVSCESEGDKLSPGYASDATVTPAAFLEGLSLPEQQTDPSEWLGEAVYSDAGTLLSLTVCGEPFTGAELRQAFSLRSAAVRVGFVGDSFRFDVTGYGHGVGLSQYGADYYARQGMDYREIIAHYYPGAEITDAFA